MVRVVLVRKVVQYVSVKGNESITYPIAQCGMLLIRPTCTTCSSEKHEAEVSFNQHVYDGGETVRP